MRLRLRIVAPVVALAALTTQSAHADPQGKRIALSVTSTKQPFIAAVAKKLDEETAVRGMKLTVLTSGYDAAAQDQQLSDAIAQKFDMLAVTAFNAHAIVPVLTRAKQAGIPVVLVNNPIEEGHEDIYLSLIGENKVDVGALGARAVLEATQKRKTAKVAILSGAFTDATAQLQLKGFHSVADQNPKIQIVATEDARWDMANSERIAGQLLTRFGPEGVDVMFTMVDSMAFGIIQAAKAADVPLGTGDGQLIVVSSGCAKFGLAPLRSGELYSSANVVPGRLAVATAQLAADHFNGKSVPKNDVLPLEEITKANVEKFAEACSF
jgi:ABC-type sugar transport system substrate-binding protein